MSSASFSTNLHSIECCISIKSLSKAQTCMCLVHECIVLVFFDIGKILISNFSDVIASYHHCVIFSHSWNNFILLCLIVDNWLLNIITILKLFSKTGVTSGCYYSQRHGFWWCTTYMLTDWHHCGITNFWVPFFLYLSIFSDRCVLS